MPLIPWEYIEKYLILPPITLSQVEEKLNYYGLETKLIKQNNNFYLDINTFPNRPDLLSWWGVIREIGILLNCRNKLPRRLLAEENKKKWCKLAITGTNKCYELHLGLLKNVEIKESLPWIKEWLKINGFDSINNIVDIANLVMLETGHPLHIFDYDALPKKQKTNQILIRRADEGEKFITLNQQKLILDSEDLVISVGGKAFELAGIIGNQETVVNTQTRNILIECASYDSEAIKETVTRLNIFSRTSQYFSRGTNLVSSPFQTLQHTIDFITQLYGGDPAAGIVSSYRKKKKNPLIIAISPRFITEKIGQFIPPKTIETIWKQLGFRWQRKGKIYYLTPPSYRPDVTSAEDLLEELLKIYDYNEINSSLLYSKSLLFNNVKEREKQKEKIRTYLANYGWQEIITYSLISPAMKKQEKDDSFYQLLTPKSENHKYYRSTLIPSHLEAINYNLIHGNKNLFFFEISSIYILSQPEELLTLSGVGKLINQPLYQLDQENDFYWLKGFLENIFFLCGIGEDIDFSPAASNLDFPFLTEISLAKEKIGFLGQVKQKKDIFVTQISLTKIFAFLTKYPRLNTYKPISNFPISEKDLSFFFPADINYLAVIKEMKKTGGDKLIEAKVFDIYQNTELEKKGKKSVSFRLVFQNPTRTLESQEIEKKIKNISQKIENLFAAELRD